MNSAVVHIHPHFSHFSQSILLAKKLFDADKIIVLRSSSLQPKNNLKFYQYLLQQRTALSYVFSAAFQFSDLCLPLSRALFSFFAVHHHRVTPAEKKAILYAVRDSLTRSNFSYLYHLLPRPLRGFVDSACISHATYILANYKRYLKEKSPSVVVASHSTYYQYLVLALASVSQDIPFITLSGAVDRAWITTSLGPEGVLHITNYSKQILDSFSSKPSISSQYRLSTSASPNSLYALDTTYKPPTSSSASSTPLALLLYFHCIKDNNHVCSPSRMLYESYFDWTVSTCLHFALNESNWDKIIIKIHPHARQFGDLFFLRVFSLLASSGVNSSKISILDPSCTTDDLKNACSGLDIVPVTFHGSIAYESVSMGISPIVVGDAPGPSKSYVSPRTTREYKQLLSNKHLYSHKRSSIQLDDLPSKQLIDFYESMKPRSSSLVELILSQKRYFYFDQPSIPLDSLAADVFKKIYTSSHPFISEITPELSSIHYTPPSP